MRDVPLEVPLPPLLVGRLLERDHTRAARVEVLHEALDGAALARGVATLEQDHDARAGLLHPRLQLQQLDLQAVLLPLVALAREQVLVGIAAVAPALGQPAAAAFTNNTTPTFTWGTVAYTPSSVVIEKNQTITITVEISEGGGTGPTFRKPVGTGTTLDLAQKDCGTLDVVVEDPDSAEVVITQEEPVIAGASLQQDSGLTAKWSWCPTPEQIDAAVRQLVSKGITTDGQVIDVFTAAGLPKPDISILSDGFLAEVRGLKHKNVAAELLEKLLKDELKVRSKRNLVQSQLFSEKLKKTLNAYHNRAISTMEVIEELIRLAKELDAATKEIEKTGVRSRAIERKLRDVEALPAAEAQRVLPEAENATPSPEGEQAAG